jgi:hypothetical protein
MAMFSNPYKTLWEASQRQAAAANGSTPVLAPAATPSASQAASAHTQQAGAMAVKAKKKAAAGTVLSGPTSSTTAPGSTLSPSTLLGY